MLIEMERKRTRPTLLIVEDFADSRQMLKLVLEGLDYRVLAAGNGKDALAVAENNDVDLILTDFDLPDMTGPTLVRYLRELCNKSAHIPVVVLTAFDGYEYRELAAEAGCDAFFIKPPDFEILQRTVERLLQEREARKNGVTANVNGD